MKNPITILRLYGKVSRVLERFESANADRVHHAADPQHTSYASVPWWTQTLDAVRALVLDLPVPEEVRQMLLRNWKTTLSGLAALLAIASKVAMTGQFDWGTDSAAIVAAIGLITAKDGNVSGTSDK